MGEIGESEIFSICSTYHFLYLAQLRWLLLFLEHIYLGNNCHLGPKVGYGF
jgi:hypothetical protein